MAIQSAINQSLAVVAGAVTLGKHAVKEAEETKIKDADAEKKKTVEAIARKQGIADAKEAIAKKGIEIEKINDQMWRNAKQFKNLGDQGGPELERFQLAQKRLKQLKNAKKAQQTAFRAKMKMLKEADNG